ncbi:hypothetical protein H8I69_23195 [Serratia fonticola]|uniref:hypothetical protein n=1 Tax=Serratia fonticola TaxID=47917 RepID=UPI0016450AA3|nr:hypothetical protein [Serratia fonticola]MBC3382025.1 hypothetical protein [Serratia fonticola]
MEETNDYQEDENKDRWSAAKIQALRKRKVISQAFKELNEDESPSQPDNSGKESEDWDEK